MLAAYGRRRHRAPPYRNAYYARDFVACLGTLGLRIARTREKSFLPYAVQNIGQWAEINPIPNIVVSYCKQKRRGGRVAEGGGLLNRYTVKSCIGGSNPPLSARTFVLNNLTGCDTFGDTENRRLPSSERRSQSHQAR